MQLVHFLAYLCTLLDMLFMHNDISDYSYKRIVALEVLGVWHHTL